MFDKFHKHETLSIHLLRDQIQSFVSKILGMIVITTTSVNKDAKESGKLLDLDDLLADSHLVNSSLFISFLTKVLRNLLNVGDSAESAVTKFNT